MRVSPARSGLAAEVTAPEGTCPDTTGDKILVTHSIDNLIVDTLSRIYGSKQLY